jgi:Fic family protein
MVSLFLWHDLMNELLQQIDSKKQRLDGHRPLPPELVKNLDDWFRVELTYTSNAIEGNTLSRQETALVVEKGLTVAGKSLREHLEAINHAHALDFIGSLVTKPRQELSEIDVLDIHNLILQGNDNLNAGRYRHVSVRIAGSTVILPNWVKVPDLMQAFYTWMHTTSPIHPVLFAADAHFQLVSIHPFVDGNGRTARLLMNLLLLQQGYPPALIRKEDRQRYISSLEQAQLGGILIDYYRVICEAVERSLDIYLEALEPITHEALASPATLLKIGELAKATGENTSTLRYWTQAKLLQVASTTAGGYQLYSPAMIIRVQLIRKLQHEQRLTIDEIRQRLPLDSAL